MENRTEPKSILTRSSTGQSPNESLPIGIYEKPDIRLLNERLRFAMELHASLSHWPMTICGPTCIGKSSAAWLMTAKMKPLWLPWMLVSGGIVSSRLSRRQNLSMFIGEILSMPEEQFWRMVSSAPIVVIDDLVFDDGHNQEDRKRVLRELLAVRSSKPMIITHKMPPKECPMIFGQAINDFFDRGSLIYFKGKNLLSSTVNSRVSTVELDDE